VKAVCPMPERENGVPEEHARPGVPHDDFHLLPPINLIAVNRTFDARGLGLAIGTSREPKVGVTTKLCAGPAQARSRTMDALAVDAKHRLDRPTFPFQSAFRLHENSLWRHGPSTHDSIESACASG